MYLEKEQVREPFDNSLRAAKKTIRTKPMGEWINTRITMSIDCIFWKILFGL